MASELNVGSLKVSTSDGVANTQVTVHNNHGSNAACLHLEGKRDASGEDTSQVNFANSGEIIAAVKGYRMSADDVGELRLQTSASGTSGLGTRLTIDSAGTLIQAGSSHAFLKQNAAAGTSNHSGSLLQHGGADKWLLKNDGAADSFIIYNYAAAADALTISSAGLATFSEGIDVSNGFLTIGDYSALQIVEAGGSGSGGLGAITVTDSLHHVDTEGGSGVLSTDNLDTINGGSEGTIICLCAASSARTVVLKDGTGNLALAGDFSMNNGVDLITLIKIGSTWTEQSRSNNQ